MAKCYICVLFGGNWNNGVKCSSRSSVWAEVPMNLGQSTGARGVAEPRVNR